MRRRELAVSDRVLVYGGYDMDPAWLAADPSGYSGEVIAFIPGQNAQPAAVIRLDGELVLPDGGGDEQGREVHGRYLVLELGHVGTDWGTECPRVHVELCEDQPPGKKWEERANGVWVESHATYTINS